MRRPGVARSACSGAGFAFVDFFDCGAPPAASDTLVHDAKAVSSAIDTRAAERNGISETLSEEKGAYYWTSIRAHMYRKA